MSQYVLAFEEIDKSKLPLVGGKGANLGELLKAGVRVPWGFCVTTVAYEAIIAQAPGFSGLLDELAPLKMENSAKISEISGRIRTAIEAVPIPQDIAEEVARLLHETEDVRVGQAADDPSDQADIPYAVRSSATAEDLPAASFAGQQDTYLNVISLPSILQHISRCWASLFTERAVVYRMQNGFDHRAVRLAVVVQRMVFPVAAGILFTADPVTSNRKIVSIDASFGLGEALVSGLVDADLYKVQNGQVLSKKVPAKKLAICAREGGGTEQRALSPEKQNEQALPDERIIELAGIGRKIETHFGCPQDIEYALCEDGFAILQSRPITTLYPVPQANDGKNHVYLSMGHQQMMTDALTPLGASLFPKFFKNLTSAPMLEAGGRLYLDVSSDLASPVFRKTFIEGGLGSADPLIQKALQNVVKRTDFMKGLAKGKTSMGLSGGSVGDLFKGVVKAFRAYREDDAALMPKITAKCDAFLLDMERRIGNVSGTALFDFIDRDFAECYKTIVLENYGAGILSALTPGWLNKNIKKWLGEEKIADFLAQSADCNVTTEMGLDLLDVADAVRNYPAVLAYLRTAAIPGDGERFFEELATLPGGPESTEAIGQYLCKYGARCTGEIDIARPRWAENPAMLAPIILNNVDHFAPGSRKAIAEEKRRAVEEKTAELTGRLRRLPGGRAKARKAAKQMSVLRHFVGFREYPKFAMMRHFLVYKRALLREAEALAQKGVIRDPDDIFFLRYDELRDVVATGRLDYSVIRKRRTDHEAFSKLTPPRVMTSDGEIIAAEYDTDALPADALCGLPVSAGVVEGRARVVHKLEDAHMEEGDILVTAFTDPSWTALFVSIKGLVTEVGGMMTHGAVVAREYGIPAVVSVENATERIRDGQQIRINGTKGYVELL